MYQRALLNCLDTEFIVHFNFFNKVHCQAGCKLFMLVQVVFFDDQCVIILFPRIYLDKFSNKHLQFLKYSFGKYIFYYVVCIDSPTRVTGVGCVQQGAQCRFRIVRCADTAPCWSPASSWFCLLLLFYWNYNSNLFIFCLYLFFWQESN